MDKINNLNKFFYKKIFEQTVTYWIGMGVIITNYFPSSSAVHYDIYPIIQFQN